MDDKAFLELVKEAIITLMDELTGKCAAKWEPVNSALCQIEKRIFASAPSGPPSSPGTYDLTIQNVQVYEVDDKGQLEAEIFGQLFNVLDIKGQWSGPKEPGEPLSVAKCPKCGGLRHIVIPCDECNNGQKI